MPRTDGIGFGITHSMVTLMFEQSLQLVNPKLSLPYWDFTIDAYLVDEVYGGDYDHLRDVSDLWTPEWFGSVDPEDYQVRADDQLQRDPRCKCGDPDPDP